MLDKCSCLINSNLCLYLFLSPFLSSVKQRHILADGSYNCSEPCLKPSIDLILGREKGRASECIETQWSVQGSYFNQACLVWHDDVGLFKGVNGRLLRFDG